VAEVTARCPRCKLVITASPDEQRLLTCPQCGARLRAAADPSVAVAMPSAASPGVPASALPPSPVLAGEPTAPPSEGLQAGIRALLRGQEEGLNILREILAIVRSRPAPVDAEGQASSSDPFSGVFGEPVADDSAPSHAPPLRKRRRRKGVLIVDDDDKVRRATEAAFATAQVPVRAVPDGRAAMAAIAAEKPDVIILELGLSNPMTGSDLINMIKATMEWVDIPIVLYTRLPIESQKEARTTHGADDLFLKGSANADGLVARAIQIFQSGG